jgi:hypothetical protein
MVVARPVDADRLEAEIVRLRTQLGLLRGQATSEAHQVDLERGRRRFRELVSARAGGLWDVHVLAGGASPTDARLTASLLSHAVSSPPSPLVLVPASRPGPLGEAWQRTATGPDGTTSPFTAGAETLARLAPPPSREVPGVRSVVPPRFDLTPETPGDVVLGRVLDETLRDVGPFGVTRAAVNRHVFVCGATGSGKSQTTKQLLESLARAQPGVPWLVVEPVKAEYAGMSGRLADRGDEEPLLVIRPGALGSAPASINPLEPEPGYPLQSHVDLVRALFVAAFQATEPFPQVLVRALTDCYAEAGWDLVTGRLRRPVRPKLLASEDDRPARRRFPTLTDLQSTARRVVAAVGYGPEVTADVRGFVDVRMGSLRQGAPGRFFEGGHPIDVGRLLRRRVVLELESVTNDQDQAFLIGTVVIRLVEHLRVHRRAAVGLRHVLVIEEAHRLLRHASEGPAAAAVEFFAGLLAEIRAYGEGVVVVEQIPSKIILDVVKNTAVKVMHRLPAQDDRAVVGAAMNLQDDQSESVVALPPGVAAVAVDGSDRPLLIRVPGGMGRESAAGCDTRPPLSDRRSQLCGARCRERPCSLEEMAQATAASEDAAVVVWVEAAAAALVTGLAPPRPRHMIRESWPVDPRLRECALASAADRAAGARRSAIARWVDVDDFGDRLRSELDALLTGRALPSADPRRWRAGPYRWLDVQRALSRAEEETPTGGRDAHPDTAAWAERGLVLDAEDVRGQWEQLELDPAYAPGSHRVVLGDTAASGLTAAVRHLGGSGGARSLSRAVRYVCRGPHLDAVVEEMVAGLGSGPGPGVAGPVVIPRRWGSGEVGDGASVPEPESGAGDVAREGVRSGVAGVTPEWEAAARRARVPDREDIEDAAITDVGSEPEDAEPQQGSAESARRAMLDPEQQDVRAAEARQDDVPPPGPERGWPVDPGTQAPLTERDLDSGTPSARRVSTPRPWTSGSPGPPPKDSRDLTSRVGGHPTTAAPAIPMPRRASPNGWGTTRNGSGRARSTPGTASESTRPATTTSTSPVTTSWPGHAKPGRHLATKANSWRVHTSTSTRRWPKEAFPHLTSWAREWSAWLAPADGAEREVPWAVFPSSGPKDVSETGFFVHFRDDHDWIINRRTGRT